MGEWVGEWMSLSPVSAVGGFTSLGVAVADFAG
jgi:hypothetical protein